MSRFKTRRADDYPIPVQITTAPIKPKHTSPEEVADLLKKLPFVKVLDELGGLVIRAATQDKLDIAVINAMAGAKKQGMYLQKERTKLTNAEKSISFGSSFEACRQRAVERVSKRKEANDKPKTSCMIGTMFGKWKTTSDTFYDEPYLLGAKRSAKVHVECECGTKDKKILSQLKQGRSKECSDCSSVTRLNRFRTTPA